MPTKNSSDPSPIDEGRFQNMVKPPKEARGEWTNIVFILDRSGSMKKLRSTAIEGFNKFLSEQQKEPGWATFTLVLFSTTYELLYDGTPLSDVKPLDEETYVPDGGTSLRDAIGKAITETKARIDAMAKADRPAKVLFAILTDGEENSSTEYGPEKIKAMIKAQQECGWPFLFLAADEAALQAGINLNIDRGTSFQYKGTTDGTQAAYTAMSSVAGSIRRSGLAPQSVIRNMSAQVKSMLDVDDVEPVAFSQNPAFDAGLLSRIVDVVSGKEKAKK